ncbi:hypothetical protein GTA09_19855 [Rhodococcus hoagii]|nr:hypothetical protein [Prescottella equi]
MALDVWFADPEAIDVPGLGAAAPTDSTLNPLVLPCEKARWPLGVLMVALLVVGLFMSALSDGEAYWWVFCAVVVSGGLSAGADRIARHYRAEYENRLKVGDQLNRGRMRHVQANPSPPELKLALHVAQTAHNIENSPAFASEYLSSHRRRVNLHQEVARLSADARDLWIERRNLIARDDIEVADASPLLSVLDVQERDLKAVWDGLVLRAEALDRYLATVRDIEPRLTYLVQLEAAADRSSRITELKIRTLEHEHAAGELDNMSAELSAVREAIDELVRGLDEDAAIIERRSLGRASAEPRSHCRDRRCRVGDCAGRQSSKNPGEQQRRSGVQLAAIEL